MQGKKTIKKIQTNKIEKMYKAKLTEKHRKISKCAGSTQVIRWCLNIEHHLYEQYVHQ